MIAHATDGWERRKNRKPNRLWLGTLDGSMTDPETVDVYIKTLARRMYIDLGQYNVEIEKAYYNGSRSVYVTRRPVEDVITDLL